MAKTSPHLDTPLRDKVEQLAAFEPTGFPVVSLYLDLTADQHGRERHDAFRRKAFAERVKSLPPDSPERSSLEQDVARIDEYLATQVEPSANGVVIFASSGSGGLFEAVQLDAPIEHHWLFVGAVPHLYPLVRVIDQFPRYAAVQVDSNRARIVVFALGGVEKQARLDGVKTRRHSEGGMSQARYQRHTREIQLHHMKDVADALDRIVRADNIHHVVIAADEQTAARLRAELPLHVADKVAEVIRLDREGTDDDLSMATLDALRQRDVETDAERVADAIGAWRAGGLGVAGPEATMRALQMGQVEELLIAAAPDTLETPQSWPADAPPQPSADSSAPAAPADPQLRLSDELVTRASQTGARVRMIEDPQLLAEHGGVAATLRFRI